MIKSWLGGILSHKNTSKDRKRPIRNNQTLRFEHLEDRTVPSFLASASISTGASSSHGAAVADLNGDKNLDIISANGGVANQVSVILGNGNGTFQPALGYTANSAAYDVTTGDYNADGKIDIAVANNTSLGNMSIMLGNGDGTFQAATNYGTGSAHSIRGGDFNGDGKADLATVTSTGLSVFLGNGDGSFQQQMNYAAGTGCYNLLVFDTNNDGKQDLVTSNVNSLGTVNVLLGNGDGSFQTAKSSYAYSAPVSIDSGDFNHDGIIDLAVCNSYVANSMSVLMGNGDGTYQAPQTYGIPSSAFQIEVADFNGDGNDDIVERSGTFYVQLGRGDGSFYATQSHSSATGNSTGVMVTADFNNDGARDIVSPDYSGSLTLLMNANDNQSTLAGAVTFQIATQTSITANSSLPMTISAVDANGNVATGYLGTVYIRSNDPASPTTLAYTFTAADAGVHSFSNTVRFTTLGTQTFSAEAPFLTTVNGSVTVTPGVSRFVVVAPTSSVAGSTFDITVSAVDSLNSVAAGYGSSVHFASSDALAGLPSDYTFTAADAGVHTFQVTLIRAVGSSISVRENGSSGINGFANVSVTPATVSSLTLAGGAGAIGVSRPITIVARDAFGNVATGYSGMVNITSSDPLANIPANTTLVNGVATVYATFRTVGMQTLTATDTVATTITGTVSSDATPPVAALFEVTNFPATVAGVVKTFTVTVKDTIGQVATGYTGTVYFSSSDVQAGLPLAYVFTAADAGKHTFTATLKTAGSQTLTVNDFGGLTGTQSGIAVSAAAFTSYRTGVAGATLTDNSNGTYRVTAGDVLSVTVTAVDAFGNRVSGYNGKIKFTSNDTIASLPTDYNFTAADAGQHMFTLMLKTATPQDGYSTISIVDASMATTAFTLPGFSVTNAAASQFSLSIPSKVTAGTAFTVKVTVLDAFGNKAKNYFGTVHFANTVGIVGLPSDYSFTTADAGVHSFTVTLNTAGTQTISIGDLANLLSTSFTINVGSATTTTTGGGGGGGGSGGGGKKV